jgi:competence protein ComEC
MALFHPHVLWDIGFQLSFMATLGLVLYADPLSQAFQRLIANRLSPVAAQNISRPVSEYFLFTLAAQVTSLPVILYHFGRLSLTSLLANPLILPAQPAVMVLGGLSALLGLVWPPLGRLAAFLAWPFTAYTIRMVELLGRIPHGELVLGSASLGIVLLFYGLLFGGAFAWPRLTWVPALLKRSLLLSGLGAATIVVWQAALAAPDGHLHLTLLDVGGGDGLLLQTPAGRTVLIDGGSNPSLLSDGLGRRLPLAQRQLDWLVVGGVSREQLSAVPDILERFPVENVLWAGTPNGSKAALTLHERLARSETPIIPAQPGQVLELGSGALMRVLSVGERGAVLLLEWRYFHALLPLGMDFDVLESLQQDPYLVQVEALLLAENGLASLNPPEWIDKLRPQVVLLSTGADDPRSQPDTETLEAVDGYTLLRTDRNGWIQVNTDGERMWVEVER